MEIQALIFDFDGTIADTFGTWDQKVNPEMFSKRNMVYDPSFIFEIKNFSFTTFVEAFKEKHNVPEKYEDIREDYKNTAIKHFISDVKLRDGIVDFLKEMDKLKLTIGIASSCGKEIIEKYLEAKNLLGYFKSINTSCDVENAKPFPDVYLKAADDLGVSPKNCVAFEDTPGGAKSAKDAGMMVVGIISNDINSKLSEMEKVCDYMISDYNDALKLIFEIRERGF